MALTFKRENMADDGKPVVESTTITASNGAELDFSPQWQPDRFNTNAARIGITPPPRGDLDSLFFAEEKGNLSRVEGSRPHNNAHHYIQEPDDIAKLAGNFGIPAADIAGIHYVRNNGGKVSEASVELREVGRELSRSTPQDVRDDIVAAHNETAKQHLGSLAVKLESAGLLPAGTAFEMDKAGVATASKVMMETRLGPHDEEVLSSMKFGVEHSSLGQGFTMVPGPHETTRVVFGRDHATAHGSIYRSVSEGEFKAAEKIAKDLGVNVIGESGTTPWGGSMIVGRPIQTVVGELADKGIVGKDVARELAQSTIALPIPPSLRRQAAGDKVVLGGDSPKAQPLPA